TRLPALRGAGGPGGGRADARRCHAAGARGICGAAFRTRRAALRRGARRADIQALRCALSLRGPVDPQRLYLAAGRGLAPHITRGTRITIGEGVAGKVAASREPLLVVDAADVSGPLLGDEYLTTGSFISFPLVMHDELIGVVNLTNRAQHGLFVEEDVERVRLLGLVIALIAREADLPEQMLGTMRDR